MDTLIENVYNRAKSTILDKKTCIAMFYLWKGDTYYGVPIPDMNLDDNRDIDTMRMMVSAVQPDGYALATDAHMGSSDKRPKSIDDIQFMSECLVLNYVHGKEKSVIISPYVRYGEEIEFGEIMVNSLNDTDLEGRGVEVYNFFDEPVKFSSDNIRNVVKKLVEHEKC